MFCSKCGQAVEEGVNFCNKCGNNLSQKTETEEQVVNEKKQEVAQVVTVIPSGTAPLVMGLLGMFGGFIPVVKYFTGILSLVAIFVGASQRKRLKNAGLPSGKATAGLVLGIIAVLITIISIVITGMFLGSLFSSHNPGRTASTYSYVAPVVPKADTSLDGAWTGGDNSHWLIVFSGENVTLSENINYKHNDWTAKYARRYKGHFDKTKNFDTPAGYFKNENTEKYTFIYTQAWRDGFWEELDNPIKDVLFMSKEKENEFVLTDTYAWLEARVNDRFYKQARTTVFNYE